VGINRRSGNGSMVRSWVLNIKFVAMGVGIKKAGIFYTNNLLPTEILMASLDSIKKASEKHGVEVLTSSWEPLPYFENHICDIKDKGHLSLYYQILGLLFKLRERDVEVVSFLEHDTIYGEDYFSFNSIDGNHDMFEGDVLANRNYIGITGEGYVTRPVVNPLHQLTMKLDYAIEYFSKELIGTIEKPVSIVEPNVRYSYWDSIQKSIHVNWGGNFTSHYQTFGDVYSDTDEYWGDSKDLINKSLFREVTYK